LAFEGGAFEGGAFEGGATDNGDHENSVMMRFYPHPIFFPKVASWRKCQAVDGWECGG